MDETSNYQFKINNIVLKNSKIIKPNKITVFVGANNCGKTQLLKDIIEYISKEHSQLVILDDLDIAYPITYEEFVEIYPLKYREGDGLIRYYNIAPTLDRVGSQKIFNSVKEMENQLKQKFSLKNQEFLHMIGEEMITFLSTDNRLNLVKKHKIDNYAVEGPKDILSALYDKDSKIVSLIEEKVKKIFNINIYFDSSEPGVLQFRVGKDFSNISSNNQDAYKQLSKYKLLDDQGDGLRSFVGILTAIISLPRPVILLDEPEAFLHPPQAMQLGAVIAELINDSQQIFISTHSADFLRGLLSATKDAEIVHLSREGEKNTNVRVLNNEMLNKIIADPLLSSSRVLEGMFYKGVVATEADADALFYQRLYQMIGSSDEIHFINAHNKQTLKKIIEPYKSLGIRYALIADADVIRDKHEFMDIIKLITDEEIRDTILQERTQVYDFFKKKDKKTILFELQSNIKQLAIQELPTNNEEVERVLYKFRKELKKLRDDSDELAIFKQDGRAALTIELQKKFDDLWNHCAGYGLFIVSVGELESWLIDYGIDRKSNKSKWISEALNKLYEIDVDSKKEIWKFMNSLKEYFYTVDN